MAAPEGWKKASPDFVQFEEVGQHYAGKLISKGVVNFPNGDVGRYTLEDDEGNLIAFLGGAVIDRVLDTIEIGTDVYVEYTGDERTAANQTVRLFDVFTR